MQHYYAQPGHRGHLGQLTEQLEDVGAGREQGGHDALHRRVDASGPAGDLLHTRGEAATCHRRHGPPGGHARFEQARG